MNILFCSPESFPIYKSGGLGDVTYALTKNFAKLKHSTFLVLPGYTTILNNLKTQKKIGEIIHPVNKTKVEILSSNDFKPVKLIILKATLFENKDNPYVDSEGKERIDNFETFSLLSWATSFIAYKTEFLKCNIDIVISNDWQTGLVSAYIKELNKEKKLNIKSAHIIHNIAFAGIFSPHLFFKLGLPNEYYNHNGLEYYDKISFQKSALYYSDYIFTVSPNYANEISTKHEFGMGFEGLLNERKNNLQGIINGVDYDIWSPKKDNYIKEKYSYNSLEKKMLNKIDLINEYKLNLNQEDILIGMVSRISTQKGFDLVINYLQNNTNFNFIIIGMGDKELCNKLKDLSIKNNKILFIETYNETLSHKIIAGCDLFLMPSIFEPCGLTQLYSMKYGTLPIVNPIGGLKDTVIDYDGKNNKIATGFYLNEFNEISLKNKLIEIEKLFKNKTKWKNIIKNAMQTNFSWQETANKYLSIFNI